MALLPARDRDKYMLVVIIAALALTYLFYDQMWSPRNEELDATQAHVDSLLVMNQRAKSELAQGKTAELKAEADRYAQDLEIMRQLVPTGNEVPALLEQVSTAARRSGLDISDVSPQPVLTGDQYDAYKYKLSVRGAYQQIGDLLTNIGSMQRIVSPINLTLAPLPPDPKRPKTTILDAHFEIQTYVSRTAPTKPATPLKGGRTGAGE